MGLNAIVIGATGLVGSALLEQLCQSDRFESVVAISRRPLTYTHRKLSTVQVDFEQLSLQAKAFAGDVLFSCLGTTKKQAGSIAAQRVVDVDYQYQAAQLARQAGVKHLCLVSSSGAHKGSLSAYLDMKGDLEEKVKTLGFERFSIFQPSVLVGQRDHRRFAEEVSALVLPWVCRLPGLKAFRPIQGQQVARRMLQVATEDGVGVKVYRLADVFPSADG